MNGDRFCRPFTNRFNLDGTREFVARNGEFCVMIGLAIRGRARLGVVAVPALAGAPLLVGEVGHGAFRVDASGARHALSVSTCDAPERSTIVVSRSRRSTFLDRVFAALGGPNELPCGSVGVKIAKLLLDPKADGYVHLAPPGDAGAGCRWDVCAPEAILIAAGGRFTDQHGVAIDYADVDLRNRRGLVASNALLHDRLVAAAAPVVAR